MRNTPDSCPELNAPWNLADMPMFADDGETTEGGCACGYHGELTYSDERMEFECEACAAKHTCFCGKAKHPDSDAFCASHELNLWLKEIAATPDDMEALKQAAYWNGVVMGENNESL